MGIVTWFMLVWGCWVRQDWHSCYVVDHCWSCTSCCVEEAP